MPYLNLYCFKLLCMLLTTISRAVSYHLLVASRKIFSQLEATFYLGIKYLRQIYYLQETYNLGKTTLLHHDRRFTQSKIGTSNKGRQS